MKLIGTLDPNEANLLREWCRKQPLVEETKSSYVNGRKEKWFFHGSNLQSVAMGRAKVWEADIPEGPGIPNLIKIANISLPGWNSLLVCGGPTTIKWHRDHTHFFGPAVMVNLGEAIYYQLDRGAKIETNGSYNGPEWSAGSGSMALKDGEIVWIDTKRPHMSVQKSAERFNLTFRTIKPEFML